MFFTKHNATKCPNCSFNKAHSKRNSDKKEILCYYCGYHELRERMKEPIKIQSKIVVFRYVSTEEESSLMVSDTEWFINEYILNENTYVDLTNYKLFTYEDYLEEDLDFLLKEINKDDYHYVVVLQGDGEFKCISYGEHLKPFLSYINSLFC